MAEKDVHNDPEKALYSNKVYFESCIRIAQKLFEEKLYEDCINYIEKTASFGWFNFSGYYKSGPLEVLLAKIQQKILPPASHQKKQKKTNKILHICSIVYTSGGHSKLLYNWIKNDSSKKHTILSTRLSLEELTEISHFYLADHIDAEHISVKSPSKIESAKLLNRQLLNGYDAIALHIHPDETITNIVLSQKDITTPVCFINHADHVFWLGTSVADIVLQIRESSIPVDEERRDILKERQFFLPIPIETVHQMEEENTGHETHFINLLSTGTAYKYNPNEHYNFLREAYKIAEENPDVIFHIVGIDSDYEYAKEYQHERIVLHGIVSPQRLAEIEKTTDIYIEGYPMPSFTALLQAALRKIPFALHYNPLPLFKLFSDNNEHHIVYPKNLDEWHSNIRKLIRDKEYRKETSQKQHGYILNSYSIEVWKSRIQELYQIIDKKEHTYRMPNPDRYYNGENEKLLVTIDKRAFSHYSFTENMSLLGKYFVYKMTKPKNPNINYFHKKQLINYFRKKE
ncbi:glycosyltransferase family protein [Chryseobacterium luteum]|uniref:glycosyltransferase family 1 protein n=1 Tax=Chryseobacterium luteum TaxID=421531 RepID=UPI00055007A4|nr:glycosyltransferase family 1 protein [Chryseobacterium luteum]